MADLTYQQLLAATNQAHQQWLSQQSPEAQAHYNSMMRPAVMPHIEDLQKQYAQYQQMGLIPGGMNTTGQGMNVNPPGPPPSSATPGSSSDNLISQFLDMMNNPSVQQGSQMQQPNNTAFASNWLTNSPASLINSAYSPDQSLLSGYAPLALGMGMAPNQGLLQGFNPVQFNQQHAPDGSLLQQAGLPALFNSTAYQAMYGTGPQSTDPTQRFHEDPGFQFNLNRALDAVNRKSAAQGLLESGATQRDLLETAQGLQNQQYNHWQDNQNLLANQLQAQRNQEYQGQYAQQQSANQAYNNNQQQHNLQYNSQAQQQALALQAYAAEQAQQNQQYGAQAQQQSLINSLFGNYQNQLAQQQGFGASQSGADQANQLGQLLGTTIGGWNYGTGNQIGNWNIGVGNNLSQLLANLGSFNGSAILNTGAAQANAVMQQAGMNAQVNNNNAASQGSQNAYNNAMTGMGGGYPAGFAVPNSGFYGGDPLAASQGKSTSSNYF